MITHRLTKPFNESMRNRRVEVTRFRKSTQTKQGDVITRIQCEAPITDVGHEFKALQDVDSTELANNAIYLPAILNLYIANVEQSNPQFNFQNAKLIDLTLTDVRRTFRENYIVVKTATFESSYTNENGEQTTESNTLTAKEL